MSEQPSKIEAIVTNALNEIMKEAKKPPDFSNFKATIIAGDKALTSEIEKLKSENTKLKEQIQAFPKRSFLSEERIEDELDDVRKKHKRRRKMVDKYIKKYENSIENRRNKKYFKKKMVNLARFLGAGTEDDYYDYLQDSDEERDRKSDENFRKDLKRTFPKLVEKKSPREDYNKNNRISKEISILFYEDKYNK